MAFIDKFASRLGVLDYKGTWDAEANSPNLTVSPPKKGHYYIVSAAGSTNLDGISTWEVGDWAIHSGQSWQKMDAADKAKTSQLETSLNSLSISVANITTATQSLPNLSSAIGELQLANLSVVNDISNLESSLKDFKLSEVFYVAKNGNDADGTGAILNPFLSISGALAKISTLQIDSNSNVVVLVGPGVYSENVALTRPKTHLIGLIQSKSNATTISGSVSIAPSAVVGGLYNSTFTIENFLISSNSDAISITGDKECNVFITNVYCFTSGVGQKRGIVCNQTSSTKTRLQIINALINNASTNSNSLYLSNTYTTAQSLTCYSGASESIQLLGSTLTANDSWLQNNYASVIVSVNESSVFSVGSSYLNNQYQNGSGVSIAPGGQVICANNVFQITGTSGFAVSGALGSVFMHANNCFIYGTSNKISSAIATGNIPMSSSFTPA
jgi:hypothetical protein